MAFVERVSAGAGEDGINCYRDMELLYVRETSGYAYHTKRGVFPPNTVCLLPPGFRSGIELGQADHVMCFVIKGQQLSPGLAELLPREKNIMALFLSDTQGAPFDCLIFQDENKQRRLMPYLQRFLDASLPAGSNSLASMAELVVFLHHVVREYRDSEEYVVIRSGKGKVLADILFYINSNLDTANLDSLCGQMRYSKAYLCRLLRQISGKTFVQIVTERRLTASLRLLEQTQLSIDEIASAVGFTNQRYMTKVFQRYCGMTPIQYRRKKGGGSADFQ